MTENSEPIRNLIAIGNYFKRHPILQAIWLIDRDRAFTELVDALYPIYTHGLFALQMYQWHTKELDEHIDTLRNDGYSEKFIERTFPFRQSGIWFQMSDGKHRRYETAASILIELATDLQKVDEMYAEVHE